MDKIGQRAASVKKEKNNFGIDLHAVGIKCCLPDRVWCRKEMERRKMYHFH